ncbi:MAG: hypothetical protein OEL76_16560 [Siculibacillus sp.]|nr:hypothetical protein [Siculibacillus sp.]
MSNADPLKWRAIQSKYASYTPVEERADYERGLHDAARCGETDRQRAREAGERRIAAEVNADGYAYIDSCRAEAAIEHRALTRLTAREEQLVDQKYQEIAAFNSKAHVLDIGSSPVSSPSEDLRIAWEKAAQDEDVLRSELRRPPAGMLPNHLYVPMMLLAFLGEIPLNATALELLSDLQNNYNWYFAGIVGSGFVGAAHLMGTNLRQIFGSLRWTQVARRATAILLLAAAMLFALAVLSQLRDHLLKLQIPTVGKIGTSAGQVVLTATQKALSGWLAGVSGEALQLAMLNVFVVILALTLAYFHVDPDDRYDLAVRRAARAKRAHDRHREKHLAELKRITEDHHRVLASLDRLIGEVRREQKNLGERLDLLGQSAKTGGDAITRVRERRLAAYVQGFDHGSARKPPAPPPSIGAPKAAARPEPAERPGGGEAGTDEEP